LAGYDDAIIMPGAARLSVRLHRLLLQIGGVQEFLDPGLLLSQVLALQSVQFRSDVARGAEVLHGRAVSRLGDDWRQLR
jgi:hypothetical protein